jgi:hypothetical protein
MAATFGAGTVPSGAAVGTDGLLRSHSTKESCETYNYRDGTGETKEFLPGKLLTKEVSVDFYGSADLSAAAAGAFTAGTLKMVSAKTTESNEGAPEGTHTYKTFSTIGGS